MDGTIALLAGTSARSGAAGEAERGCELPLTVIARAIETGRPVPYEAAGSAGAAPSTSGTGASWCVPASLPGHETIVACVERRSQPPTLTDAQIGSIVACVQQTAVAIRSVEECRQEFVALQARLNSPFLHNTFSVIAEMVAAEPTQAESALVLLSRYQRYVIESASDQIVTLGQELSMTEGYLRLEQHRIGERMQIVVRRTGPIDEVHLPSLTLQALVETAIRGWVERCAGGSHLAVEVTVTDSDCRFVVGYDGLSDGDLQITNEPTFTEMKRRLVRFYPGAHAIRVRTAPRLALTVVIPREAASRVRGGGTDGAPRPTVLVIDTASSQGNQEREGGEPMLPKDTGLLAFIYHVYTSKEAAAQMKSIESAEKLMTKYGLTDAQKHAVWASGVDPKSKGAKEFLGSYGKTAALPPGSDVKDREHGDRPTMQAVCDLLVAELTADPHFPDAW
jgi:hypothetical protein